VSINDEGARCLDARTEVDWSIPKGKPDFMFGTDASALERRLVWLSAGVGAAVVAYDSISSDLAWSWWQWVLAVFVVVDVVGGVTANSLGSAKRLYAGSAPRGSSLGRRFVLNHVVFAAAHVHPFVAVAVFGDGQWRWAFFWYVATLLAVVAVRRVPVYLQRPVALGVCACLVVFHDTFIGPAGMAWLGPVLVLKLAVAHSVVEAPFRPRRR
jgi:hypothetical protein